MQADKTYNGWTNWDTWNANLWLSNEEGSYKTMQGCTDDMEHFANTGLVLLQTGEPDWIDDWGKRQIRYRDDINPANIDWPAIHAAFTEE